MGLMGKLVRIMWVPVLLTAFYSGWVLWQRHRSQTQPATFQAVDPLAKYGSHVKIVQFYTTPDAITKGRKALLCYSVVNATVVRLDPPVESVWPSMSRCFEVAPRRVRRCSILLRIWGAGKVAKFLIEFGCFEFSFEHFAQTCL